MRAARCDAGPVTSIFSTSCPPSRKPFAMASTVSTLSNSASSSLSVRRRLWVNAIFTLSTPPAWARFLGLRLKQERHASVNRQVAHPALRILQVSAQQDAAVAAQGTGYLFTQGLEVLVGSHEVGIDAELERFLDRL